MARLWRHRCPDAELRGYIRVSSGKEWFPPSSLVRLEVLATGEVLWTHEYRDVSAVESVVGFDPDQQVRTVARQVAAALNRVAPGAAVSLTP